jgi:hypothetical protein
MLIAAITMTAQVNHLTGAPLGYRTENLINISFDASGEDTNTKRLLAEEFRRLPVVKRTGFGAGTPFDRGNNHTMHQDGKNISFQSFICDETFFELIGWEKLRDNNVSGEAYYLNEHALRELEIEPDAPAFLGWLALGLHTLYREAALYGRRPADHCLSLLAHGLAHLLGHDHGKRMDRVCCAMRGSVHLRKFMDIRIEK